MSLNTESTFTTGDIIAASSTSAQAVMQITKIQKQWEMIVARPMADIKKEPFISDARKLAIKTGGGNTTSLKSINRIPTATQPLEEGVTPTGQGYTFDTFDVSVAEYGSWTGGTNQTDVVTSFGTLSTEVMKALKLSAEESKAKIVRDTVVAQASEFFAGGAADKDALAEGNIPTIVDMFSIRRLIIRNRGKLFAGNKVKVVADTEINDVLTLWDPVVAAYMNYGNTNGILASGEIADMMGLHFVFLQYGYESDVTMIERSTSGARITPIVIYGKDSFVIAEQKGGLGIKMIFKPTGSSGTSDPLNQRWTLGWYIGNFGVKVKDARHIYAYWVSLDQAANQVPAVLNVNNIGN